MRNLLVSLIVILGLAAHAAGLDRCFTETNRNTVTPTQPTQFTQFQNSATIPLATSPLVVLATLRICFDQVTCGVGNSPIAYLSMIWSDGTFTDNSGSGFTDALDATCQQVVFTQAPTPAQVTAITAWTSAACFGYITRFDFTVNTGGVISTSTIGAASTTGLTSMDMGPIKGPISGFVAAGKKPPSNCITAMSFMFDDCFCQQQVISAFPAVSPITMVLGTPKTVTITKPTPLYPLEGVWTTSDQCTPVVIGVAGSHAALVGTSLTVTTALNEGSMIGAVTDNLQAYFPYTQSVVVLVPLSYTTTALCSTNPITQTTAFSTTSLTTPQGGAPVSFTFNQSAFSGTYTSLWSASASAPLCVMSFKLSPASGSLAALTSVGTSTTSTGLTNTVTMTNTVSTPVGTTSVDVIAYWSAFPGDSSVPTSTQITNPISLVVSACNPVLVLTSDTNSQLYYKSGSSAAAIKKYIYVAGCSVNYTFTVTVAGNSLTSINYPWLTIDSATSPGPTFLTFQDTTTSAATDGTYAVTIQASYTLSGAQVSNTLAWTATLTQDVCINTVFALAYIPPISFEIPSSGGTAVQPKVPFQDFSYSKDAQATAGGCGTVSYTVSAQVTGLPLAVYANPDATNTSQTKVLTCDSFVAGSQTCNAFTVPTMAQTGSFVAKVTGTLTNYPQWSSTIFKTMDVVVQIGFVCSQTTLTCDSYTAFVIPFTGSATAFTFTDVTDTTGVAKSSPTTLCGPRSYSLGVPYIGGAVVTTASADTINNALTYAAVTSPLVSLNTATRTFSITPQSTADFGYFYVTFNVWLKNFFPSYQTSNLFSTTQPKSCQIQIQVVPNCNGAVLSSGNPAVADMPCAVQGFATQTFGAFTSTVQGQYNNYCGIITYVMTAPSIIFDAASNGASTNLSFDDDNRIITYKTETTTQYSVTITATLKSYPTRTFAVTFKVWGSKLCMVSQVLSYSGRTQPSVQATIDVTTNTPINLMYHFYQQAWAASVGGDPCNIGYTLVPLTAGEDSLCKIDGLTIVCKPVSAAQASQTYQYNLVGSFVAPFATGDSPAASTQNTLSFSVSVAPACTTITVFEPGRTITPDQRFVIGRDDQLSLPFTFAYYPPCTLLTEYVVTVWMNSQNRLTENIVLSLFRYNMTATIAEQQLKGETVTNSFGKTWITFDPSVPRIVIWSNSSTSISGGTGPPYEDEGIYPITVQAFLRIGDQTNGIYSGKPSLKNIDFVATLSRNKCILTNFMTSHTFKDMYFNIQDPTKVQDPVKTQQPQVKTASFPDPTNLSVNQMTIGGDFYSTQMWPYYTDWMTQDTRDNCFARKYEFNGELADFGVFTWGTLPGVTSTTANQPLIADVYNLSPNINKESWDNWIKVYTADPYYCDKWTMNFTVSLANLQDYRGTVHLTQLFTVQIDSECMRSKFVYSPFPDLIHRFSNGLSSVPFNTMTITDIIDEYSILAAPNPGTKNGLDFCQGRTYTQLSVSCTSVTPATANTCSTANANIIFTQPGLDLYQVQATDESQYGTYKITFNVGYTKYQYMQDPPYNIPAFVPTVANPTAIPPVVAIPTPVYPAGTLNSQPQLITADKHNILQFNSLFAGPRPTIYTFTGRVVPDCAKTLWTPPVIQPMYTTVGAAVYQTIALFTYSEQLKFNSFCGPITIDILTGSAYGLSVDPVDKTKLTLAPTATSTVGTVTAQFRATISNAQLIFPPTSSIASFQVTVYSCTLTTYDAVWAYTAAAIAPIGPERYQVSTTQYIEFSFAKAPACNYLYDNPLQLLSLNPNNHWFEIYIDNVKQVETWNGETKISGSWVWIDYQTVPYRLMINTVDRHLEGSHTIKVRNWDNQVPKVYSYVDMNFNLFVLKDDCVFTKMVSGTIPNMNFEISYDQPPKSITFSDFVDSVSLANPANPCGPRTYTITAITLGGLHIFDSATRTFTFYTTNSAHTGLTFQYSVYGILSNWPQLEVYAHWTATFSVIVSARCQNTIFRVPKFPQYWVNVATQTGLSIPVVPDTVSILDGTPESYCGPRTYSISFGKFTQVTSTLQQVQYADHSAFTTPLAIINSGSLVASPPTAAYVGFHQVFLTVGLQKYTLLHPLSIFEFQINVNIGCQDLTTPTRIYAPYNMKSSVGWQKIQQQFFNVTTFSDQVYRIFNSSSLENQYCGNNWSYSVTMANATFFPWFLNYFYYEGKRLVGIQTPKVGDVAEYWFRYVFQHSDYPQLNSYDTFNLTISYPRDVRPNMPPGFSNIDWSPSMLYSDQTLKMQISFGDPDGDDLIVTYKWDGPDLGKAINKQTGLLNYTCPKKGNGTTLKSTLVVTIDDGHNRSVTKSKQIWCIYDVVFPPPVVITPVVVPKSYNQTSTVLSSVTNTGLVTIQFSNALSFGKSWASRYNKTGTDFHDILDVTFIPGNDPDQDQEGFHKNLDSFDWTLVPNSTDGGNQIQLQLNFSDPLWVSQGLYPDQIAVQFKNPDAFRNSGDRVDPDIVLQWYVPCQILNDDEIQYIENYFGGSSIAFKAVIGVNFLVTMAMGASITPMIIALRSVQIISHLPMVKTKMPANTVSAIGQIQDIATFNLFDTTKLDYLMYKNENADFIGRKLRTSFKDLQKPEDLDAQPLSQPNFYYDRSKLNNCMFISNVGLPLYVIGAYAAWMISIMQILRLFKKVESIGKVYNWLYSKLTWSFLIIFLFETSLHSVIAALLNLQCQLGDPQNSMAYISYIFSIACLTATGMLIIAVGSLMVYSYKQSKFKNLWWQQHFGTIFRDLDTDNRWALAYPVWFLVSRVLFACLVVFGKELDGTLQLTLLQVICLVQMVYNGWVKPIRMNPRMQTMSLINDFMTLFIVVYCGLFTDFENDPVMRYDLGWGFMGLVGLYFVANGLVLLCDAYQKGYIIAGRYAFQYAVRRHLINHPNTFKDIVNPEKEVKVHDPNDDIPVLEVVHAVMLGEENPIFEENQVLPEVEKEYVGSRTKKPDKRKAIVQTLDPDITTPQDIENAAAPVVEGGDIELGQLQHETQAYQMSEGLPRVLDDGDELLIAQIEEENEAEIIDLDALQRQRIEEIISQSNNPQFFSASKHGRIKTKGWVQPNLNLDEDQELGGRYQ